MYECKSISLSSDSKDLLLGNMRLNPNSTDFTQCKLSSWYDGFSLSCPKFDLESNNEYRIIHLILLYYEVIYAN